jgi:hypothetical protein
VKRALPEHLEDYHRHLLAKGDTEDHADKTRSRIQAIRDGCRFVWIRDLSASAVEDFLHALRRDPTRPELPPGQESFTKRELLAGWVGWSPPSWPAS